MYSISIFLVSSGANLIRLVLRANCYGFVLITLTTALALVGFYSYTGTKVETPRGDLMLLRMTGALGVHLRLNSYRIYPISGLIKQTLPLSSPTSKGRYSR